MLPVINISTKKKTLYIPYAPVWKIYQHLPQKNIHI